MDLVKTSLFDETVLHQNKLLNILSLSEKVVKGTQYQRFDLFQS